MVTDEIVEAACRARWDALDSQFTGYNGDVAHTWDALVSLFPTQADRARASERATLSAVLPDYRKQVIEEVAAAIERPNSRRFPGRGWDFQYAAALRNYAHEDE